MNEQALQASLSEPDRESDSFHEQPIATSAPSGFSFDLSNALANIREEVNQLKQHISTRVSKEVQSSETSRQSTHRDLGTNRSAMDSDFNPSSVRTNHLDEYEEAGIDTRREMEETMVSDLSERDSRQLQNETFAFQEYETEYRKSESALNTTSNINKSSEISIDTADRRQISILSLADESVEDIEPHLAREIANNRASTSLSVYDARTILESQACVIRSQKNDIANYRKCDRDLIKSYDSDCDSQIVNMQSPISKYAEQDRTKAVEQQIRDLAELKKNVQQFVDDVKNGDDLSNRQLAGFGKKHSYTEVKGLCSNEDRAAQRLAASNNHIVETTEELEDEKEEAGRRYEYDDMYYEDRNRELVQEALSVIFSTNESKYESLPQPRTTEFEKSKDLRDQLESARSGRQEEVHASLNTSTASTGYQGDKVSSSMCDISALKEIQEFRGDAQSDLHSSRTKHRDNVFERSASTAISHSGQVTPALLSHNPSERKILESDNELRYLERIKELEVQNEGLNKNVGLLVRTLKLCEKEIDTLAHHNKKMRKYEGELANMNRCEKELSTNYENRCNEVEYLKRELQSKERKAAEHIQTNTELTKKIKVLNEYTIASDSSFLTIHKALKQLSKSTDKSSLATHLEAIFTETSKFVRHKRDPLGSASELDFQKSILKDSSNFVSPTSSSNWKTGGLIRTTSEDISPSKSTCSSIGRPPTTPDRTSSVGTLTSSNISKHQHTTHSPIPQKRKSRSRSRSLSAKRGENRNVDKSASRDKRSERRDSASRDKSPLKTTFSGPPLKKRFELEENLQENLRKQVLESLKTSKK